MKKRFVFLFLVSGLYACNLDNPEANRIVGTWTVEESVAVPGNTANPYYFGFPAKGTDITFTKKGELTSNKKVFSGGWCNWAERYSVNHDTLYLEYSKAGCIPFVPPRIADRAAILTLNRGTLKIRYEGYDILLSR